MKKTAKKDPLNNLLEIILKRKLLLFLGFISAFSIILITVVKLPKVYEAYARIYIGMPAMPAKLDVPYIDEYRTRSFISNQQIIILSREVLAKVVSKLRLHEQPERITIKTKIKNKINTLFGIVKKNPDRFETAILYLLDNISVNVKRGTNIFTIVAKAKTPEGAALIANTVAETYIEYTNSSIINKAKSAYSYLETQVEKAKANMAENEDAMNKFKERKLIEASQSKKISIETKLAELEDKKQKIEVELNEIRRKRQDNNDKNGSLSEIENTEKLQKLQELKGELAKILTVYTEEHPDAKLLQSKIEKLENETKLKNVDKIAKNEANNDVQLNDYIYRLNALSNKITNQINSLKRDVLEIAKTEIEYEKLARNYYRSRDEYTNMLAKLENAKVLNETQAIGSEIRILDPAYPPTFSDKKLAKIVTMIGFVASLLLGIGMTMIAEYFDTTVKNAEQIEKELGVPVLGVVPIINRKILMEKY